MSALEDGLAGRHLLITGATGFVGQALLERLLACHPTTRVTLLVRGKGARTGAQRAEQLLNKPVFRRWREEVGAEGVARAFAERCTVLDAGLGDAERIRLPDDLDLVLHSASDVTFDPPVDRAFATNVEGVASLYAALRAAAERGAEAGRPAPAVVHVSTAYVGGARKGLLLEAPLDHDVDWRAEGAAAASARPHAEAASREPSLLRDLQRRARRQTGAAGTAARARTSEQLRREWVEAHLVEHGRTRATSLGWTDVYTLTKALAERIAETRWAAAGHRLTVVRPSIIESALRHPAPGWIDGYKVADPLVIAYGRGLLPQFPGLPDSVLDLIPVDLVVNAVLAAAALPPAPGEAPQYLHVVSGSRNPLPFHEMHRCVREFFTATPLVDSSGPVQPPEWLFPGARSVERRLARSRHLTRAAQWGLEHLPPSAPVTERLERTRARRSTLDLLAGYSRLYTPYVQTEMTFGDDAVRALHARLDLPPDDDRGIDVTELDWDDYLGRVHFPAITSLTRAFDRRQARPRGAATPTAPAPLPQRSDALAVFDLAGTVVQWNLLEQYLSVRLATLPPHQWAGELTRVAARLPGYLLADRRDRGEFVRSLLRRTAGTPVADLRRAAEGSFAARLDGNALPQALERVAEHRRAGHRTVLVSGAVDLMVEPLAHHFDDVVASRLHATDGVLTGFLEAPPLVGETRAAWLVSYAQRVGADLRRSYGYGDSAADVAWLSLLGHPQVVNPDARLRREARARSWPVHSWGRSAPNHSESASDDRSEDQTDTAPETAPDSPSPDAPESGSEVPQSPTPRGGARPPAGAR